MAEAVHGSAPDIAGKVSVIHTFVNLSIIFLHMYPCHGTEMHPSIFTLVG